MGRRQGPLDTTAVFSPRCVLSLMPLVMKTIPAPMEMADLATLMCKFAEAH